MSRLPEPLGAGGGRRTQGWDRRGKRVTGEGTAVERRREGRQKEEVRRKMRPGGGELRRGKKEGESF